MANISQVEHIACQSCDKVPEAYICFDCSHSFCLNCLAKMVIIMVQNNCLSKDDEGFVQFPCSICQEINVLDQQSLYAIEQRCQEIIDFEEAQVDLEMNNQQSDTQSDTQSIHHHQKSEETEKSINISVKQMDEEKYKNLQRNSISNQQQLIIQQQKAIDNSQQIQQNHLNVQNFQQKKYHHYQTQDSHINQNQVNQRNSQFTDKSFDSNKINQLVNKMSKIQIANTQQFSQMLRNSQQNIKKTTNDQQNRSSLPQKLNNNNLYQNSNTKIGLNENVFGQNFNQENQLYTKQPKYIQQNDSRIEDPFSINQQQKTQFNLQQEIQNNQFSINKEQDEKIIQQLINKEEKYPVFSFHQSQQKQTQQNAQKSSQRSQREKKINKNKFFKNENKQQYFQNLDNVRQFQSNETLQNQSDETQSRYQQQIPQQREKIFSNHKQNQFQQNQPDQLFQNLKQNYQSNSQFQKNVPIHKEYKISPNNDFEKQQRQQNYYKLQQILSTRNLHQLHENTVKNTIQFYNVISFKQIYKNFQTKLNDNFQEIIYNLKSKKNQIKFDCEIEYKQYLKKFQNTQKDVQKQQEMLYFLQNTSTQEQIDEFLIQNDQQVQEILYQGNQYTIPEIFISQQEQNYKKILQNTQDLLDDQKQLNLTKDIFQRPRQKQSISEHTSIKQMINFDKIKMNLLFNKVNPELTNNYINQSIQSFHSPQTQKYSKLNDLLQQKFDKINKMNRNFQSTKLLGADQLSSRNFIDKNFNQHTQKLQQCNQDCRVKNIALISDQMNRSYKLFSMKRKFRAPNQIMKNFEQFQKSYHLQKVLNSFQEPQYYSPKRPMFEKYQQGISSNESKYVQNTQQGFENREKKFVFSFHNSSNIKNIQNDFDD